MEAATTALDWDAAIERVLAEPAHIQPAFQPVVDLERGVAIGYEMLARFDSEIEAPPPAWLAEAERPGLGRPLGAAPAAGSAAGSRPRSSRPASRRSTGCPTTASSPSTSARARSGRPTSRRCSP